MRQSIFALLAAGMFVFAGTSDLRAQDAPADASAEAAADATADAAADATADATADAPSDVQVVDATILNPGAFEPMALNVEFSGFGDSMTAALTVPDMEGFRMEMNDLRFSDKGLTFTFLEPGGTTIDCDLMRLEDDSFRGECDAGGVPIEMTIEAFEE